MPNKYAQALHAEMMARLKPLEEEGVIWLGKVDPSTTGTTERKPWKKGVYPVRCIKCEEVPNRFYMTPEELDKKYGKRPEGQSYWVDEKGNKVHHNVRDMYQFSLTFEVVDGAYKSQWAFVYASKYFTTDGKGKLAKIALALNPDYNLEELDTDDFYAGLCMAVIEPKDDPQYGRVTEFIAMEPEDKVKYDLGATDDGVAKEGDEPIPF